MFEIKITEQEYVSGGAVFSNYDYHFFKLGAQGLDRYFRTLGIKTFLVILHLD